MLTKHIVSISENELKELFKQHFKTLGMSIGENSDIMIRVMNGDVQTTEQLFDHVEVEWAGWTE